MRSSVSALALIRRQRDGHTEWLAQWNERWQCFHFVGGHKLSAETFRDCVSREVAEELRLAADTEFTVASDPAAHLEYVAWSRTAGEQTEYTVELFDVRLIGPAAGETIAARPENRWLTEREIEREQTDDGLAVSRTMALLMTEARLWSGATCEFPPAPSHTRDEP